MAWLIVVALCVPLVASFCSYAVSFNVARAVTVVAGAVTFITSLALIPAVLDHGTVSAGGGWLRADALSMVFLVATAFLYATTAIFAGGYLHLAQGPAGRLYSRRFYAGLNLFCWSLVAAPLVNGLALLWVMIEITTVVSALLVAIEDTEGATEAAWKYVLLASLGLGIALLATIIMYYAGTTVFGSSYGLSFGKVLSGAAHFSPGAVRVAFVLAVLGFGTKMGLVPVHTWLPDTHSEAPTPVSALLSGSLLATSFYAILRFYQIAVRTLGPTFPRDTLLVFGVASLLLAALYMLSQRDLKRLLAYSSVEHMGIMAIGMSFGAPIAIVGVLLHVIAHATAKGTAFYGAGSVIRKFATKDLAAIRGGIGILPWSGPLLLASVLGLSAMPPSGIFRSEFLIVSGGLADSHDVVAAILVILVTVAFFGLSWSTTKVLASPDPTPSTGTSGVVPSPGEVSPWIVVSMLLGIAALVLLGVHPPGQLSELLHHAASQLASPS